MGIDDDFHLPRREGMTPEEEAFLKDAERIGREVAGWSDEEVAAYNKKHGLQELVTQERVDEILRQAAIEVRKRRQ